MLNISIAQINPTVGDIKGNLQKIESTAKNSSEDAHIIVFPELSISGYFPEDLLLRLDFAQECMHALDTLKSKTKDLDTILVVGTPYYEGDLFNSVAVLHRGELLGVYHKSRLPNYSVFDEKRYFREGGEPLLISVNGHVVGFSICEDTWYPDDVERFSVISGAELIINVNASPFHVGKHRFREGFVRARAQDNICFVVYANMVGGHEELVFDGRSMVIDPMGEVVARAKAFEEDILSLSLDMDRVKRRRLLDLRWRNASVEAEPFPISHRIELKTKPQIEARIERSPEGAQEIYQALVLGTRDYVKKNGFEKVVIGLSGGMDSSLTACIAVDALGAEKVLGVFMPSRFSSQESFEDAKELAENLGIEFHTIPIDEVYTSYYNELVPVLGDLEFDTADENIQARIRANLLFYLSNKMGYMVLSTSNKSEAATGYTTIYGDMAGGFAPLKDVYKTLVYKLAQYRNSLNHLIPDRVFKKPPSAELRPQQTDQDTLPPYEVLDQILEMFLEENMSVKEIEEKGFEKTLILRVIGMIKGAEYKRKQAPVGVKITPRAFGKDWRMPVVNKFNF